MRVRVSVAGAVLLAAALTACGGGGETSAEPKAAASKEVGEPKVDCAAEDVSQAEWMEYCSEEDAGAVGDEVGQSTGLKFGESYTWPDGLKVTVVEAKVFTDYDGELLESAEPGMTDFRLSLKLENTGKVSADLGDLSTIVEGATNGGQAAFTQFENGARPLEGRLASGVSATKTDDNVLESKYGKKVVVTVQRSSEDFDLEFPEFEGEIIG